MRDAAAVYASARLFAPKRALLTMAAVMAREIIFQSMAAIPHISSFGVNTGYIHNGGFGSEERAEAYPHPRRRRRRKERADA